MDLVAAGVRGFSALVLLAASGLTAYAFTGAAAQDSAPATSPPPPTAEQQRLILARVSRESLRYQRELPNLVCTQVTKRSVDETGTGKHWKQHDLIEVEDNYVGRFVNHKLLMIDKKAPGKRNYQQLNGFLSETVLHSLGFLPRWIFGPQAKTRFEWRNWSTIDGKPMHVFSVRLPPAESQFTVLAGREAVVAGIDGVIYVDAATSLVQRFEIQMDLPPDSVVEEGFVSIDYGSVDISGQKYLLPLKAEVRALAGGTFRRNEIEVARYQKYDVETTVHFDQPAEDVILKSDPAPRPD